MKDRKFGADVVNATQDVSELNGVKQTVSIDTSDIENLSKLEIEKYQEDALSKLDVAGRMYEQIDLAQLIDNGEFKSLSELKEYLNTQSTKLNSILKLPYGEWVMTENCCLDIDATLAKSK